MALVATLTSVAAGCNDSGQTGSPFSDPPKYEGPAGFSPPAGDGDGSGGGAEDPGLRPEGPPSLSGDHIRSLGENHAAVLGDDALHVVDRSGTAPVTVASLPLRGRFNGFVVVDDWAVIGLKEEAAIDSTTVPEELVPAATPRLVLVDLSDPASPRRLDSVDLPGDIWEIEERNGAIVVLQEVREQLELSCPQIGEWSPPTAGMVVQVFDRAGDELTPVDSADLSANVPYAFAAQGTYFAESQGLGADRSDYLMSWTRLDGQTLSESGSFEIEALVRSLSVRGDLVVSVDDRQNLDVFNLDAGGSRLGRLADASFDWVQFVRDAVVFVQGESGAALVDLSVPTAPIVAHSFDADVGHALETPHGMLTLGASEAGALRVQLWNVEDPSTPVLLDTVEGAAPASLTRPTAEHRPNFRYFPSEDRLLIPSTVYEAGSGNEPRALHLTAIDVSTGSLELVGETTPAEPLHRPLLMNDEVLSLAYDWSARVFGVFSMPVPSSSSASGSGTFTTLGKPEGLDSAQIDGVTYSLRERPDGVFVVQSAAGQELELSHWGDALIERDGRLVVLGLRGYQEECMAFEAMGMEPVEVPDPDKNCASYRGRGISIVSVDDGLKLEAAFPLGAIGQGSDVGQVGLHWNGYFLLPNGTLGLPAEITLRCESQEECESLGIEAHRSVSSPGCNPESQDCSELPTQQESWTGTRRWTRVYSLDVEGAPSLDLAAEIDATYEWGSLEVSLDVSGFVLPHGDSLGLPRSEELVDETGAARRDDQGRYLVRFFLDRLVPDGDGWRFEEPVNTPGLPIAWVEREIFSVEPRYPAEDVATAVLHRSLLRNGGAFIDESHEFEHSFQASRQHGDTIYLMLADSTFCAEEPSSVLVPLAARAGAIDFGSRLRLPYRAHFPRAVVPHGASLLHPLSPFQGDELWLPGGPVPSATFVVDISSPRSPKLTRYTTEFGRLL